MIRATLTITIDYDSATTNKKYIEDQLRFAVSHLANEGLLSGDGPAEIENWKYTLAVAKA